MTDPTPGGELPTGRAPRPTSKRIERRASGSFARSSSGSFQRLEVPGQERSTTGRLRRPPITQRGTLSPAVLRDLLKKLEGVQVAYLLVSDGLSEKCAFFSVGAIRFSSIGQRRGLRMQDAIAAHSDADAGAVAALPGLDPKTLEEHASPELRKVMHACSRQIIRDELLDLLAWEGAEYEFSESNPPETLFEARVEALKLSLGVKDLLQEVVQSIGEWQRLGPKLGTPARQMLRLVGRADGGGPDVERAVFEIVGSQGTTLERLFLLARRRGHDVLHVGSVVEALVQAGRLSSTTLSDKGAREDWVARAREEIDSIQQAMDLMVDQLRARRRLAEGYEALGQREQALEQLRLVGEQYERQAQPEEAIQIYREIATRAPTAFYARERIAGLYEGMRRFSDAATEWLSLARAYAKARLFGRAETRMRRVVQLQPAEVGHRRLLADLLQAMGKKEDVAREQREIERLAVAPPSPMPRRTPTAPLPRVASTVMPALPPLPAAPPGPRWPWAVVAGVVLVLGAGGPLVLSRRRAAEELERTRTSALGAAGEGRWAEARAALERFRLAHPSFGRDQVEEMQAAVSSLEQADAARELELALAHEKAGRVREAHRGYELIQTGFPAGTPARQAASERLQELDRQLQQARGLLAQVREAVAADDVARAWELGQRLRAELPWSEEARGLELPLRVSTTPPGASVEVDGAPRAGKTPCLVLLPPGKPVLLRLQLEGWTTAQERVELSGERPRGLAFELQRAAAWRAGTLGPVDGGAGLRGSLLVVAGSDQRVYGLGAGEGDLRWTLTLPPFAEVAGAPLVCGRAVIVADSTGQVLSLDQRSGQRLWRQPLGAGVRGVAAWKELGVLATGDELFALRAEDGGEAWRLKLPAALAAPPTLTADGRLLVALGDGRLAGYEAESGRSAFEPLACGGIPAAAPVGAPGGYLVLLRGGRELRALGSRAWSVMLSAAANAPPLVDGDGRVWVAAGSDLVALSPAGAELWRRALPGKLLPPLLVDGRLFVGTVGGELQALEPTAGELRWRMRLPGEVGGVPLAGRGLVYLGGSDAAIYAVRPTG